MKRAVLRGLAVDPARRHPSMGELLVLLEGALRGRGFRKLALAAIGILAVAGAIFPFSTQPFGDEADAEVTSASPPTSASSEEDDLVHEAEAKALRAAGKLDACVAYALDGRPSRGLLSIGLNCAYEGHDFDGAGKLCERWRASSLPPPPDETCHPASVKHYALLHEQRFADCLALARAQPETALSLSRQLVCAGGAMDLAAYQRACERLEQRFPENQYAAGCEQTIAAMRNLPEPVPKK